MAENSGNRDNRVIRLRRSERLAVGVQPECALTPEGATADPVVAEGMRLVRSFLLIEDPTTRASVIQLVEKLGEVNSIFKKR